MRVDTDKPTYGGFDDLVEASLVDGGGDTDRARRSQTSPADPTHLAEAASASPLMARRPDPSEGQSSEPADTGPVEGNEPATAADGAAATTAAARPAAGGSASGTRTAQPAGSKAAPAGEGLSSEVDASELGEALPGGAVAEDAGPGGESAALPRTSHETAASSQPGAKPGRTTAGPAGGTSASAGPLEAALSRIGQEPTPPGDASVKTPMPAAAQWAAGAVADAVAMTSVHAASVEDTHATSDELAELTGDQDFAGDEPGAGGRSDARSDAGEARTAYRADPSAESREGASRPPAPATATPAVSTSASHRTDTVGSAPASDQAPSQGPAPGTADRLVQSMRLQFTRGGGDAVVQIRPEHLGAVTISLRVEAGVVTAVVRAEQPAVAEWLQANQHLLKDGLLATGLHLQRLVVTRDGESPSSPRDQSTDSRRRGLRRRPTQPESTFEITV